MEKIIEAVIFDLDGVIIDSNPEIEKFWHGWAKKTDRTLTRENITQHIHGRKGVETLDALFADITLEVKENILTDAKAFDSGMDPEPITGIFDFVQQLLSLKIPLGLVTSSHNQRAQLMLKKQNLAGCFAACVTAEDVTKGKPDPQPYLAMAEKLGVRPENCLVFEDAISGVQSAKAAGMEVIGINGTEAAQILQSLGAACTVLCFDKLQIKERRLTAADDGVTYQLRAQ